MTINLCEVSGTLVAPDGSTMADVQVRFLPAPPNARRGGDATVLPSAVSALSDAQAQISVALAPGVYTVRARDPSGREYQPYLIDVPTAPAADLGEIMEFLPAPQTVYDAAASARVAVKAAQDARERAEAMGDLTVGDSLQLPDRAALADMTAEAEPTSEGRIYWAGGVAYRCVPGASVIPDLPGLVPVAPVQAEHFGAAADGVTDDGAALQAMLDHSRDSGRPWRLSGKHFVSGSLLAYSSGDGSGGTLLTTADGQSESTLRILPAAGDGRTADPALAAAVNALLPMRKGTAKIPALGAWAGQSVRLYSSARYIQRVGAAGDYRHEIFFEVLDGDGNIWPPLPFDVPDTLSPALSAEVQRLRAWVDVHLPELRVVSGNTERAALARIERCRVNVRGGSVFNETATTIRGGVSIHYVTSVRCWGLHVDGIRRNTTQYGFGASGALIEMHGCSENFCRRGFESTYGIDLKLIGGNYPDAVGGHLLFGLSAIGATIGGAGDNVRPIFVAGADVEAIACKLHVGSVGVVMDMRSDTPELTGTLRLSNCEVIVDLTNATGAFDAALIRLSPPGSVHDPLRDLRLPDSVHITDNRVRVLGSGHAARLSLLSLTDNYFYVQDRQLIADMRMIARGNSWQFENGQPQLRVTWNKRPNWQGPGMELILEDIPNLYMDIGARFADSQNTQARADVFTRNCGAVDLRCDGGSVRRAEVLGRTTAIIAGARGDTGLVGDEDWRAITGSEGALNYSSVYTGRDWNTPRPSGFIGNSSGIGAAVPGNGPGGNNLFCGWGARVAPTRGTQMLLRTSGSPAAYFRTQNVDWSPWMQFMHNGIDLPTTQPSTPNTFWRDAANGNVVKVTPS